jgi:hypothetical protein
MSFKRALWYPIAVIVAGLNVAGAVYAYVLDEPVHAFVHTAIVVTFGMAALYLRQRREQAPRAIERNDNVEMLQANLSQLESELQHTRERLEFADQLLKKKSPDA